MPHVTDIRENINIAIRVELVSNSICIPSHLIYFLYLDIFIIIKNYNENVIICLR